MKYAWGMAFLLCIMSVGVVKGADISLSDGVGIPFDRAMEVTRRAEDAGANEMEGVPSFALPPGMDVTRATKEAWTLTLEKPRGTYVVDVYLFQGTAEVLFPREKERHFWETAFTYDKEKPAAIFGERKYELREYQKELDEGMGTGDESSLTLLSFSPWRTYRNGDGTVRWAQEVKWVELTGAYTVAPLWQYANLYKRGDIYNLIVFRSRLVSAAIMEPRVVSALYRLGGMAL